MISYAPLDRFDFTCRPDFSKTLSMDLFDASTSATNPWSPRSLARRNEHVEHVRGDTEALILLIHDKATSP